MAPKLKIAAGQMCLSSSLPDNARVVGKLIRQAVAANAKVLFLPEAADYISRDAAHSVQLAETTHAQFLRAVQNEVRKVYDESSESGADRGIAVAVGVHEPAAGDNAGKKVQNNQVWIASNGEIVHRYQKLHLFDINIANGPILKELNSVEPGSAILPPFPVAAAGPGALFHVGLAICYDIRFPEFSLRLRRLGANIITYPSAFTTRTGEAHWLELARARAIDSQCYVVMAAQCGQHDVYADTEQPDANKKVRVSYGQTVIVGPWGEVLAQATTYADRGEPDQDGDYHELVTAELDAEYVEKIRTDLPVFTHRRPEIFGYEV